MAGSKTRAFWLVSTPERRGYVLEYSGSTSECHGLIGIKLSQLFVSKKAKKENKCHIKGAKEGIRARGVKLGWITFTALRWWIT